MREDREGKAMDRSDFACNEDIRERKCIRHKNVHTLQENAKLTCVSQYGCFQVPPLFGLMST